VRGLEGQKSGSGLELGHVLWYTDRPAICIKAGTEK
jgi:hypothetical protein